MSSKIIHVLSADKGGRCGSRRAGQTRGRKKTAPRSRVRSPRRYLDRAIAKPLTMTEPYPNAGLAHMFANTSHRTKIFCFKS